MSRALRRSLFGLVWVVAAVAAVVLYVDQRGHGRALVGVVDSPVCRVAPLEAVRLMEVSVQPGASVQRGVRVATTDDRDLSEARARLEARRARLSDAQAKAQGLGLVDREAGLARLRVAASLATMEAREAEGRAAVVGRELEAVGRELRRLESAGAEALGQGPRLAELRLRRDVLRQERRAAAALTDAAKRRLRQAEQARDALREGTPATPAGVVSDPSYEALIGALDEALAQLDVRARGRALVAPCAGEVVEVHHRAGAAVAAFMPVVTVREDRTDAALVWLPEDRATALAPGDAVVLEAGADSKRRARGRVVAVGAGFAPLPLAFHVHTNVAAPRVRTARIALEAGHTLLPGERVRVTRSAGGEGR